MHYYLSGGGSEALTEPKGFNINGGDALVSGKSARESDHLRRANGSADYRALVFRSYHASTQRNIREEMLET